MTTIKQMEGIMYILPKELLIDGRTLFPNFIEAGKTIETCLTCAHRERHQCGGSVIQYCGLLKSGRTVNGKLKIKCKKAACQHYKGR